MADVIVELEKVNKYFGQNHVIKDFDLRIIEGEFLTLLGPSGCGKTTILRMIAGLEDATSGTIKIQDERVEDKEAYERDVNTVFQSYALFPHMTTYENIAYGLNVKKIPKQEIKERVREMLEMVQLMGYEGRKPDMMSGGQKQRVAIARALINKPKVLLLDEPLGALDLKLRKQMQIELKRLQKKLNITFVYVTHDQEEALTMSDRIAVMQEGVVEQLGTPDEIYKYPGTKFVAGFIGESNIFEGEIIAAKNGILKVAGSSGEKMTLLGSGFDEGEPIQVCVRPEAAVYSKEPKDGFSLKGTVRNIIFVGSQYRTLILLENGQEVKISRGRKDRDIKEGDVVYIYWEDEDGFGIKKKGQETQK